MANDMVVDGFVSKKNGVRSGQFGGDGDFYANFTLVNDFRDGKKDDGSANYSKQYISVSAFSRTAEQVIEFLDNDESQYIRVTGPANLEKREGKDGTEYTNLVIKAFRIERGGGLNFFGPNNPENRVWDNSGDSQSAPQQQSSTPGF